MMGFMRKLTFALVAFAAAICAQGQPANPLVAGSKTVYNVSKSNILASAEKVPADLWNFRPTKDIRTFGQLFAHIADGQYEFCGTAVEGKPVAKDIEKTVEGRDAIIAALKEAFAYCDSAYAYMTDATAAEPVKFFGLSLTRLSAMDFDTAHNMEHYGNLITYMRLNNIVPPSSAPRTPPAASNNKK
jgi:uncharacterized damage-inducible protein DinB